MGKELVVRLVHALSDRRHRPLVAISMANLEAGTYGSQLFGHERGAFTGAIREHIGHFGEAEGGLLFMDEFDRCPEPIQDALLRPIESRSYRRLGSTRLLPVTCRLVVAVREPLDKLKTRGILSPDIRSRLGDLEIVIPPLRERRADIPFLAEHFRRQWIRERAHEAPVGFAPAAMRALLTAEWPENVRELRNAVHAGALRARLEGSVWIGPQHLPDRFHTLTGEREDLSHALALLLVEWGHDWSRHPRQAVADAIGRHPSTVDNLRKELARGTEDRPG